MVRVVATAVIAKYSGPGSTQASITTIITEETEGEMAESQSQAVAQQALKNLEDQLICPICLDAFRTPNCSNASMFTTRTASSDWWSQISRDNSPYAAPPVDNPPSFPRPLVCLASSQHSISTTFLRLKMHLRRWKSQKRHSVTSAKHLDQPLATAVTVASSYVPCVQRFIVNGMPLSNMRW